MGKCVLKLSIFNVSLARGALNLLHKHACLRIIVVYAKHLKQSSAGLDIIACLHIQYSKKQLCLNKIRLFLRYVTKLYNRKILSAALRYIKCLIKTLYKR